MTPADFFRAGHRVLPVDGVRSVDTAELASHGRVAVEHEEGRFTLAEGDAVDFLMAVKPSALEGRRLRWLRHRWAVHNLVGHPLMQVLVWLGRPKLGLRVHEATVPRPEGTR